MKLLHPMLLMLTAWIAGACQTSTITVADREATPETRQLYVRLQNLLDKGVMTGQQDALAYGIGWFDQEDRCDFRESAGDFPAVFGWEIGDIEMGALISLDSVRFDRIRDYMLRVHRMGGINTLSWHPRNPATLKSAWDPSDPTTIAAISGEGEIHDRFIEWLDRIADFLLSIQTEEGTYVPIIFRPYHELTGDWFWWSAAYCTPDEYRAMWRMTFDYLQSRGVHHLLWCYCTSDFADEADFLKYWPGDEYVDIIGFDAYQFDEEEFTSILNRQVDLLIEIADKHNKIPAFTETGYETIPDSEWYTRVLYPHLQGKRLSWVLFWRNAINRPNHFYVPYATHSSAPDFRNFVEKEDILTLGEIQGSLQQ